MKSRAHAAISLLVAAGALLLTTPPVPWWAVVVVALAVGVGIDFDHFLLARINTGHWRAARRCLRDPRIVFVDQDAIFETGEVGALQRLLSHVVIGGIAVPLLWIRWPYLAGLVAASLYAHLLADLVASTRNRVAVERGSVSEAADAGAPSERPDAANPSDSATSGEAERSDPND